MGNFIFQAILFVASVAYQQNQQKKLRQKMEAEAEKRKGFKFNVSGQVGHLPIIYGKQAIGGFQTLHKTFSSYTNASKLGDVFSAGGDWNSNRGGSKNEYLLVQTAIAQDGLNGCRYVKINDKPYDHRETSNDDDGSQIPYDNIISVANTGGSANPLATANGASPYNYFTDTAYATCIYKLNRDDQQYQGVPDTTFFMEGRKVRTVNSSGVLSTTYTYSNNPAWCLLDYLLGDFGRNLPPSEVDLMSFYHAAQVCGQIVDTNLEIGGRINGVKPIKELSSYSVFPSNGDVDFIYKAEDTGIYYLWNGSSYTTTSVPTRSIPLYECNIALDSEDTVRNNIERIMNTMGLAELIWTSEGKYKLILDYPSSLSALNNLVAVDFNEDDIIREAVTISYPAAADRYNRVTVRFDNEHEDFKEDSMSWPPLNGSVHQQYLQEDNNQPMTTDLFLDGITDPYHALAKAEQMVRQSRTTHYLTMTVGKKGLTVEPGDMIKVNIPQSDIENSIYRVESIKVMADLTVELRCYYFDYTALSWNISDNIPYGNQPTYDFVVPNPTNVTITSVVYTAPDGTTYTSLDVTWDASDSISVARYEVQWKTSTETSYRSAFTRNTNYLIQNVEPNVEYDVRVRAITSLGSSSSFADTTGTNVGKDVDPNEPTNLKADGGYGYISLNWDNPSDADLKEIEIYEGADITFSNAVYIATTTGNSFVRSNLAPQTRKYYWIRSVDRSGNTSEFVGPENDITDQLDAASFAANTIPYTSFDNTVTTVINNIDTLISNANSDIAAITENFEDFIGDYEGNISQLTLADLSSLSTDIDNNYTNTATLTQNYYTATNTDSAISTAITNLQSAIEDPNGTSLGATLSNNYYTATNTDSAISTAITNLQTAIEDPNGTSLGATLSSNYYTTTSTDSAISTAITNLQTAIEDPNGTSLGATLSSNYYTATSTDSAISTAINTLSTTVGETYATLTSLALVEGDVDGILSQYSVKIDNNGSITGYQLISDSSQNSAFNVVADQFNVSSTEGSNYSIFSVRTSAETIDGVTYPAGAYVTGYLSASNIVAGTLSSVTADLGTITAGKMQSTDGKMVIDLDNKFITIEV